MRAEAKNIRIKTIVIFTVMVAIMMLLDSVSVYSQTNKNDKGFYTNPIIKGDWSDPGIIRVGEDYYCIRSSFGWQPGVPIIHSKDLIHWRYIGYAFLDNDLIKTGDTFKGVWGAEMGYNTNTKKFIIYLPILSNIYAYHSDRPEGLYTGPVNVNMDGIDPGFFADDDGKLYLVSKMGKIMELSEDDLQAKRLVAAIEKTEANHPFEGPDIFRRNGYYYLIYSPGGTRPHQPSKVVTLRAKNLEGPWIEYPENPNLFATDIPGEKLQGPAHGTLVETQNNEWFIFYHAHELSHYSLGRQTCMEPVEWTSDGWWRPVNGRIRSEKNIKPDFSGKTGSLAGRPGYLRIKTQPGDISSDSSLANVFLQRVDSKIFEYSAYLEFDAQKGNEKAGIHMYHDPGMNFWLASGFNECKKVFEVGKYNNGQKEILWTVPNTIGSRVYLKIVVDGEDSAQFYYSADNKKWSNFGKSIYFGDSWKDLRNNQKGDPDLGWVGIKKRNVWTGATIGVFAVQDGSNETRNADFDFFHVK